MSRVLRDFHELSDFKVEWEKLYIDSGATHCFVSYDWFCTMCKTYQNKWKPYVFVLFDGEQPIAILPLMRHKLTGELSLGHIELADYFDILFLEGFDFSLDRLVDLVKHDLGKNFKIVFPRVRTDSFLFKALSLSNEVFTCINFECVAPYVSIEGDWENFFKSRSKSLKQDLRTTRNRFEKKLTSGYKFNLDDKDPTAFTEHCKLHIRRQVDKKGDGLFLSPLRVNFFENLLNLSGKTFSLKISTLRSGGKVISSLLWLDEGSVWRYWVPTFDKNCGLGSVGKFHLSLILKEAFDARVDVFDLLIGAEWYKLQWSQSQTECFSVTVSSSFLLNFKAHFLMYLKNELRRGKKYFNKKKGS